MTFFSILSEIVNWVTSLGLQMFANATKMGNVIAPIFSMGFSVYILLVIWAYQRGDLSESISDFAKRMIGWLIIIALAFNVSNYILLAGYIYQAPDDMVSWFTGEKTNTDMIKSFETALNQTLDYIRPNTEKNFLTSAGEVIVGVIAQVCIYVMGVLISCVLSFFYVITKFCLGLTLMTGPLFIGFMLFPSTRQYGMNWINQCFNYVLTVALYSLIGQLVLGFVVGKVKSDHVPYIGEMFALIASMGVLTIFTFIVVLSVPSIANALVGGGAQVTAHGRVLGQALNFTPTGRMVQAMSKQAQKGANAMGNAAMHPVKTGKSVANTIKSLFGNRAKAE